MDVVVWLRSLGLGKYEAAFRENEIDETVLPSLTHETLKELGVTAVGHRLKLLDAIAALRSDTSAKSPSVDTATASSAPSPHPEDRAERRQVTVMFSDLVGSTALSGRMDPEDLREVISAYQKCVAETVQRFGGFVAKYMGDGILVYFGYPQAHEDDAERAVRAGLELVAAVGALKTHAPLQARVGIATGLVVVGDLIGSGASQEQAIVGETPNLAARLQGIAEPNSVVMAESTRKLVGSLFELEDLGAQDLKGISGPVRAWVALHPASVESRFDALHASGLTELVGRDEELDLLLRRWSKAKRGEGQVVLLSGEPGIGKSRLTVALQEHLKGEPHTRLRYFCSPQHTDSALYPMITQLERAAGFTRNETDGEKLCKARALLSPRVLARDEFELLAELLSLPNSVNDLNLGPQRKREMLFETLLRQVRELSGLNPVLGIFEDAHWVDPTSRELLDLMIDRVRQLPMLLVITFRPEFQPPWCGQPHVTSLALNRLGARDVGTLVLGIAGNAPLGSEVVAEIVERTDGVPLFVEELTKAVLEQVGQENRVAAVLSANPAPAVAVPPTLYASLIARLDRIGAPAREVAQIGAVLGREFGYELVDPVAQWLEPDLCAALSRLTEAGLLFCRGNPPHASYIFKHALVQDAAYNTLLRMRRQQLHARAATVLEKDFADLVERQPELLAHHLTAAGNNERAVGEWLKAGQRAAGRGAHVEAIAHLKRGLAVLASLPETAERDAREIELQLALGLSSIAVRGMGSAEMAKAYGRARHLAEQRGNEPQLFQALFGSWIHNSGAGRIRAARPYLEKLLQVADRTADDGLQLQAHHSAWSTLWFAGDPFEAHAHTEAGRMLYDPERHLSHRHIYGGHDPGVCARITGGTTGWLLGYPDKALASVSEALALAERIAHPFSRELALEYSAIVHLYRGEPERALPLLAQAQTVRTEQRLASVFEPSFLHGAAQLAQGAPADAIICLRKGLAPNKPVENLGYPYGLCLLAEALLQEGVSAEALAALNEALERAGMTGEQVWQAEIHRINGLVLLAETKLDEGQALLHQALEVARKQQAKSLELRASMSLARLWRDQGKVSEARELLAPVYGWFTEGFDTRDLKEAKVLLEELAA